MSLGTIIILVIILGVVFRIISPFALLGLITTPRALRAMRIVKANFNQTLYLIPANADTVLLHLNTGLYISAGYFLQRILGWS